MSAKLPVVYLPGVDGTGELLFRQERLRAEFDLRCVRYPQDDRHTYADLVALALGVLRETGPATVLAESFGGGVALQAALARPDLVSRLVLVNTFARYPRRLFADIAGLVGPWLPRRTNLQVTRGVRGHFFFGPLVSREVGTAWWDRTDAVPMRVYGHRFRLLRDLDLRSRLGEVRAPAVVFAAPNDWIVPAVAGRFLAKHLARAKLLPPLRTGHAALIDPRVDAAAWLSAGALWS
jgi:pimeloyl-ACP methyl ester carboxylesterase